MMNGNKCGRKHSWPNLRSYPHISVGGIEKDSETNSNHSFSPGWDLNLEPPNCASGLIPS
jgi:hypothetical protein